MTSSTKYVNIIKSQEQSVNQIIDQKCMEIDQRSSGRKKTETLQKLGKDANEKIHIIANKLIKQETQYNIFKFSCLTEWELFYGLLKKCGKNTKYLKTVVPSEIYQSFQQHFYNSTKDKNKSIVQQKLRLGDQVPEDICIDLQTISSDKETLQAWQDFLRIVSNIFTTVRDINLYTNEIQRESKSISNIMLQQMKQKAIKATEITASQWTETFNIVFKYKLSEALRKDGQLPPITDILLENPDQILRSLNNSQDATAQDNNFINTQIEFISSFFNNEEVKKNTEFSKCKEYYDELTKIDKATLHD